jgi:capsid protein
MWDVVADWWGAVRTGMRYRRLVRERMLALTEGVAEGRGSARVVAEDEAGWWGTGRAEKGPSEIERTDLRARSRKLVVENAHARNALRLLEVYVTGPGLAVTATGRRGTPAPDGRVALEKLVAAANAVWDEFLETNAAHFSYREYARRTWRDGECFLRLFPRGDGPLAVRFVDPEWIGGPPGAEDSLGILTEPGDVEAVAGYQRVLPDGVGFGSTVEEIPARWMIHTKINADSNQKRGLTVFAAVLKELSLYDQWLETELTARRLQASVVLWRKVQGSPSDVSRLADARGAELGPDPLTGERREKMRPGTIVTTSQGTDLRFLHPDTNFGDAVPLGRMLLLNVAAGQGLPEFMLTGDASNGNFASTMVAEGPAVKLFEAEQTFFTGEFTRLWRMVMRDAADRGLLPADWPVFVRPSWTTPDLVNRDRVKERLADVRLVEAGVLSRAEVARRDGVEPEVMERELREAGEPRRHEEKHEGVTKGDGEGR